MRERLPRYLVLSGIVTLLIGIIVTVTLVIRRSHCTANPYPAGIVCQGNTTSIHWAYLIIVIGAACFGAAGLSATNLVQRHGRESNPVRPTSREDRGISSD